MHFLSNMQRVRGVLILVILNTSITYNIANSPLMYVMLNLVDVAAPNDVYLSNVDQGSLTFNWTSPFNHCSSVNYRLEAKNCGTCEISPESRLHRAICQNFTSSVVCSFQVHSVICANLSSTLASKPVNVTIKGLFLVQLTFL